MPHWPVVLAGLAEGSQRAFTENAVCRKYNCINPIFPALEDFHRLQQTPFKCSVLEKTQPAIKFCFGAIQFDHMVPADKPGELLDIVKEQDRAALNQYFFHLAGLGLEAWEYREPWKSENICARSVWRSVCYTYFPRVDVGCTDGTNATYKRPCRSACENYLSACNVECCDEGVQCVFTHTKHISATETVTTEGYIDHFGPSSLCTGAANRLAAPSALLLSAIVLLSILPQVSAAGVAGAAMHWGPAILLAVTALTLQGCSASVPLHRVENWRGEQDYLVSYEYLPEGADPSQAIINSCTLDKLSDSQTCSGHGKCKLWDPKRLESRLSFCLCDSGWADPECSTERKSQLIAFYLSLFVGFTGADLFYLGFPLAGTVKLLTLGGCGFWWIMDFIRIGSAPVYADRFRVSNDLPHWMYVLSVIMTVQIVGWIAVYFTVKRHQLFQFKVMMKRQQAMEKESDDLPLYRAMVQQAQKMNEKKQSGQGYGAAQPAPQRSFMV